jgi:hypothetical protein
VELHLRFSISLLQKETHQKEIEVLEVKFPKKQYFS